MKTGLKKGFDDIGLSDIQALVDSSVPESYTLEYKEQLNLGSEKERREFLADISSFANFNGGDTIGGDIIFGIAEKNGIAKEITPLSSDNADALRQQIENILRDGIKPHIVYQLKEIKVGTNQILLFFRVRKSLDVLHSVHNKVYARNSSGKYEMDKTEMDQSKSFFARVGSFQNERIDDIINGNTPVKISPKGNIVLHFIPASAFLSEKEIDNQILADKSKKLGLLYLHDWDYKPTFSGYLLHSPENNRIRYDYTHIYGNGFIETVDGYLFDPDPNIYPNFVRRISSDCLVKNTVNFLKRALFFYQSIGIRPPIRFQISLVNIKGYGLAVSEALEIRNFTSLGKNPAVAVDNNIILPECTIYDFSDKPESVLKPMFNKLWQYFGYQKCDIQISTNS